MEVGDTLTRNHTIQLENASNKCIGWVSDNTDVVRVNAGGIITAIRMHYIEIFG